VTPSEAPPAAPGGERTALGLALAAACLLYAVAIHHGIGPSPTGVALRWYEPRGFLVHWSWLAWAFETTPRLMVALTLPVVLLSFAVVAATSSALARALSVVCVVATALYLYYGDAATRVWEWFGWRASATLALLALCIGLALTAPLLAASWLRLRWPARLATYLPFALGAIAFVRNATGTDPSLRFNLSPWPAVPVFGIEAAAFFIACWLLGIAIGLRGVERGAGAARALLLVALGIAVPLGLLAAGGALALFPFRVGRGEYAVSAAMCALGIGFAASLRAGGEADAVRQRSFTTAVGAALVLLPILVGQAWARLDYQVTREVRAREIIDALEVSFAREGLYPDELANLVASGDLAAIPRPAIGFSFLYDGEFGYRSFGTSFLLEFPAPRWVECAYTPAFEDEDETDDEPEAWEQADAAARADAEAGPGEAAGLGEAWSCPSKPPELW
jgi:hypothetical protein